jgi:hypothetical protein
MIRKPEETTMKLPGLDRLGSVGMVGERKALALLCLGFYSTLFFMITLSARTELPEWLPAFTAMTSIYVVAFFGVAAECFWGRWFATGLGYWGLTMAVMAIVTTRSFPAPIMILGVMHGLISACLAGEKMAAAFDAKPAWRERWKLDEQGVIRVRRSVTRMASSLPALVMFALAPREGSEAFGIASYDLVSYGLFTLAIVGVVGFLASQRTWALFALAAAGVGLTVRSLGATQLWSAHSYFDPSAWPYASCAMHLVGFLGGAVLLTATLPFLGPIARYVLRGRR